MGDLPPQAHPGLPKGTSIEHRNKQVVVTGAPRQLLEVKFSKPSPRLFPVTADSQHTHQRLMGSHGVSGHPQVSSAPLSTPVFNHS